MAQIAAAVGGSKTTLYSHFPSKEELLLAVVNNVVEPKPEDYDATIEPQEFRAWLVWFGRATAKRLSAPEFVALQRLAAGEALRFPEVGRILYESINPGLEMITPAFAAAMDSGILRRADPRVAVNQFLEMCSGWTLRRLIWNVQPSVTDAEIEQSVQAAVATFMDGYAARS